MMNGNLHCICKPDCGLKSMTAPCVLWTYASLTSTYVLKITWSMVVMLLLSSTIFAQTYSGGAGTEADPYQIATKADIKYLSDNSSEWNKHFIQTADITFDAVDFESSGDFYNGAQGFNPIANGSYFYGTYDGQEHTIDGLFINRPGNDYVGLFSNISGTTVKNIYLSNVDITGKGSTGALVGLLYSSSAIENCHSEGTVTGEDGTGGLCGKMMSSGRITQSSSTCTINGNGLVGGLVGSITGATVDESYATGSVNASGVNTGGLIGSISSASTINNSYSTGSVTSTSNAGGLAGRGDTDCTISKCYSTGTVSGSTASGGLLGWVSGPVTNNSFWDTETSGQATSAGGEGRTTAQMKSYSTFANAGWDFVSETLNGTEDTWDGDQNTSINNGYPILAWQQGADEEIGTYFQGSGTQADPYKITSKYDLNYLAENNSFWSANAYFIQTADITFDAADFESSGDFYNEGKGFIPIGKQSDPFTGVYNGDNHVISGLKINRPSENHIGLFGYINSGSEISSLTLENIEITGNIMVGGLVGSSHSSKITQCHTSGSVTGSSNVGGLAGYLHGDTFRDYSKGVVRKCSASCNVLANNSTAGGLIGTAFSYMEVTQCYSANGTVQAGADNCGGLIGVADASTRVTECYSTANITGGNYAGGLLGVLQNNAIVSRCFAANTVSGTNTDGFIGQVNFLPVTLTNNFFDSELSGLTSARAEAKTTAQMKVYSAFQAGGWDFVSENSDGANDIWDMDQLGTVNNGYPILAWQPGADDVLGFSAGTGTQADPYIIKTKYDLKYLSENRSLWTENAYFSQTEDINFDEADFEPGGSFYNDGKGFQPIGVSTTEYFIGTYLGNEHEINGLTINRPSENYVGLFGYLRQSNISGITLNSVTITGAYNTGALVGYFYQTRAIDNCHANGVVNGSIYTGGLVGYVYGDGYTAVLNSSFSGSVIAPYGYVGGLVGRAYKCNIERSHAKGKVESSSNYVGGLVGYAESYVQVEQCSSVMDSIIGNEYVAGFAGYLGSNCKVDECYSKAQKIDYFNLPAGFAAQLRSPVVINNCYSYTAEFIAGSPTYAGGFISFIQEYSTASTITNCYAVSPPPVPGTTGNGFLSSGSAHSYTTFTRCYFDEDIWGDNQSISGIGAYSSDYMKDHTRFTGWDFAGETANGTADIWDDDQYKNINNGYPILSWQDGADGSFNMDATTLFAGDGTENSPFEIATLDDLETLSRYSELWGSSYFFIQTADIDASVTRFWDDTDNNLDGLSYNDAQDSTSAGNNEGFSPIGSYPYNYFYGSYNGNGHVISGLTINRPGRDYVGLFGAARILHIQKLGLDSVSVTGNNYTGGLVGLASSGSSNDTSYIQQCYVSGEVSGYSEVGGLAGVLGYSNVRNCYNTASSATSSSSSSDRPRGIAGSFVYSTVENSYNSGAPGPGESRQYFVGGVSNSTFTNNYSNRDVTKIYSSSYENILGNLEMQAYPSFTSWDFVSETANGTEDIWDMDQEGTVNNGWPILSWQQGADNILVDAPFNGNGSPENPFEIATLEDLVHLSKDPRLWTYSYIQTANIDAALTQYFDDTDDNGDGNPYNDPADSTADGTNEGFQPIGTSSSAYFKGTYNGQGHVISNLSINRSAQDFVALFGYVEDGANIKRVTLNAANITGKDNTGILAGYIKNEVTIDSCQTAGTVTGAGDTGGLIGQFEGSSSAPGTVSNSSSSVSVIAGSSGAGGLIGYASRCTITNSHATGTINSSSSSPGGLIGSATRTSIDRCSATTDSIVGTALIGGLVGNLSYVNIIESYSKSEKITGTGYRVGGLVGNFSNSSLIECYSKSGIVKSTSYDVGGLAGHVYGNSEISNCYSMALVEGSDKVGGFIGNLEDNSSASSTITKSYCVSIKPTTGTNLGGFIGYDSNTSYGTINKCFYDRDIWGNNTSWGGIAYYTSYMKDHTRFTGQDWDFAGETANGTADIWDDDQYYNVNQGYPILSWQDGADGSFNMDATTLFVGDGTENSPFEIATLEDLKTLLRIPDLWNYSNRNISYIQTADIDASATRFWDDTDDNLDGLRYNDAQDSTSDGDNQGFLPIGGVTDNNSRFYGNYNGNGHVIKGLTINRPETQYIGLFSTVDGSRIQMLGLDSVSITGYTYTGGLAGRALTNAGESSYIEQCYVSGVVTGNTSVGGVVGYTYYSFVRNSYSTATVSGNQTIGGVVGSPQRSELENLYGSGIVSGSSYIFPAVGSDSGTDYYNIYSNGDVTNISSDANSTVLDNPQMQNFRSFTNWDFVAKTDDGTADIWDMDQEGTVNNGWPILSWQQGADNILDAAPLISSVSPLSGPAGTEVTITGSGFNQNSADNIVYFGGMKASVSEATATSLTVTVPVAAGYEPLSVTNRFTKLTGYANLPFDVTFELGGHFSTGNEYPVSNSPRLLALGDLDGDGDADVVVTYWDNNQISVFENDGTGNFSVKEVYTSYTNHSSSLSCQDINGDGHLDILKTNDGFVDILLNDGDGTFTQTLYESEVNLSATELTDVNGDGYPDLVCTTGSTNMLEVHLSQGDGTFANSTQYATGNFSSSVSSADFDGDGDIDIVTTNRDDNTISVFLNQGDGTFAAKIDYSTGALPREVITADLDGDGDMDVVTMCQNDKSVSVLLNQGDGTFSDKTDYNVGGSSHTVIVADFDGDGDPDLGSNILSNLSLLLNNGDGSFAEPVIYPAGRSLTRGIIAGDINNDNRPDILALDGSGNDLVVYENIIPEPVITSFTPEEGTEGMTVTIKGTYFIGTSAVAFGDSLAGGFTVVNDTVITAVVGEGATGSVSVTTPGGTASKEGFTYIDAPTDLSYEPIIAEYGTPVSGVLPTVTGIIDNYSINPALPSGLSFNTTTGEITGSPTVLATQADYVVTATNIAGNTTGTIQVTVGQKELTVVGATAENKVYDGTTLAVVSNASLSGIVVGSDNVYLVNETSGNFIQETAGTGIGVNTNMELAGTDVAYYTLSQPDYLMADITQKELTITANNQSKEYDGKEFTAFTVSYEGFAEGEDEGNLGGELIYNGTATTATAVGEGYVITPGGLTSDNYNIVFNNGTLDITQKELTITAGNQSKEYDGNEFDYASFTVSYEGFAEGENEGNLGGELIYNGTATTATAVGEDYVIAPGGLTSDNYNIQFVDGTLDITQKELTITANNQSKEYDGKEFTAFTVSYEGFAEGEDEGNLGGELIYNGTATTATAVGEGYVITPGGLTSDNYNIVFNNGTLDITQKELTITANNQSKEYDGNEFDYASFTVSYEGFAEGEDEGNLGGELIYNGTATTATAVGEDYVITPGGLTSDNYNIVFNNGTLDITQKELTITANNQSKEYDGNEFDYASFTVSYEGFAEGEDEGNLGGELIYNGTATTATAVGEGYVITPGGLTSDNYNIVFNNGTLDITQKELTITANNQSKEYDGNEFDYASFTVSYEGFAEGEDEGNLGGELIYNGTATTATAVGEDYVITPGGLTSDNYNIVFNNGTLDITQKELTITANNQSKEYDGNEFDYASFTVSYEGFAEGENEGNLGGTLIFSGTATTATAVGEDYVITPGGLTSDNYNIVFNNGTLDITQKELTITANNQSKEYDGNEFDYASFTVSYEGFAEGENEGNLGGTLIFSGTATTATAVGEDYVITPGGLTSDNYNIVFNNGTLDITQKELTITANNQSKEYDGNEFDYASFTVSYEGFAEGENEGNLGGTLIFSGTATTATAVGEDYVITPGGLTSDNYNIVFNNGTLDITQKELTITANNQSKEYDGKEFTAFTVSYEGFAEGEDEGNLGGELIYNGTATTATAVGEGYVITPGGLTSDNYNIVFNNGTLDITQKELTITANNQSKEYDGNEFDYASFTVSYEGFAEGEDEGNLGGELIYNGTATTATAVGEDYVITPGGLTSDNYNIVFNNGTLDITQKELTITANNQSKEYDGNEFDYASFTVSYEGFAEGENEGNLGGTLIFSGTATTATAVGEDYVITPGGLTSDNYNIVFNNGTLDITQKELTITANNQSKEYDGNEFDYASFTVSYEGFAEGENEGNLGGELIYNGTATTATAVGEDYVITPGGLTSDNYNIQFVDGTLDITQKELN